MAGGKRNSFNSYIEQTALQLKSRRKKSRGKSRERAGSIQYKIQLRARAAKGCACSTMPRGEKRRASQMSARKNISIVS